MPSLQRIRDRLPSLYRPEDDDDSLLTAWLSAVGTVLDRLARESDDIMRSHWFGFADDARFNPYFLRTRILQNASPLVPPSSDPAVQAFPFIQDLARIGSLLPLLPWEQPAAVRETVEQYRDRILSIVRIYRRGLGTIQTLRDMVEAQLPQKLDQLHRPFWLEEFAPLVTTLLLAPARGKPHDLLGPMMRFTVNNDGVNGVVPTVYIQGAAPEPDNIDATVRPLIELYEAGGTKRRLGIAYADTITPDQTLRLRPSFRSWIGLDVGVRSAESLPDDTHSADPTAPGPFSGVDGAPDGPIAAFYQTSDNTLWVAANAAGAGSVHSFNGAAWTDGPAGLALIHTLSEDAGDLLIGTESGLLRMPLHPESGTLATTDVGSLTGRRVNGITRTSDGRLWLGLDNGAATLGPADAISASPLQNTEVFSVYEDPAGSLLFGCALGLFQWQPAADLWFWFEGGQAGDEQPRWQPFFPAKSGADANFPAATAPFLPPVLRIWRGRDAALWLGTQSGLARYTAIEESLLDFSDRLEAFPELTTGPVTDVREDARGLVWFAADRGLFRFDGRDIWQFRTAGTPAWVQMFPAEPPGGDRGVWRFNRATSQWEVLQTNFVPFTDPPSSSAERGVNAIAWTAGVVADLGQWDGRTFTNAAPADAAKLVARYKPAEDRIVPGGIPAVPALPPGASTWRYLSMEPDTVDAPSDRPWWTSEGRLLPPPEINDAPGEGRYSTKTPPPPSDFDESVFAYNPAAGVWFEWAPSRALQVLVRLKKLTPDDAIDPAVIGRVSDSVEQVRPAAVRVALAVEEDIQTAK